MVVEDVPLPGARGPCALPWSTTVGASEDRANDGAKRDAGQRRVFAARRGRLEGPQGRDRRPQPEGAQGGEGAAHTARAAHPGTAAGSEPLARAQPTLLLSRPQVPVMDRRKSV